MNIKKLLFIFARFSPILCAWKHTADGIKQYVHETHEYDIDHLRSELKNFRNFIEK